MRGTAGEVKKRSGMVYEQSVGPSYSTRTSCSSRREGKGRVKVLVLYAVSVLAVMLRSITVMLPVWCCASIVTIAV